MNLHSDNLHNHSLLNNRREQREEVLVSFGADRDEANQLLHYNENRFDFRHIAQRRFPLDDEMFVEEWRRYIGMAEKAGSLTAMYPCVPQLQFPVQRELSNREEYAAAVNHGRFCYPDGIATGLNLEAPDRCRAFLHPTAVGRIPVLCAGTRADFVTLIRAFTKKGEPDAVPDSMGAMFMNGYTNVLRLQQLRNTHRGTVQREDEWAEQFARLRHETHLFQDRFIILGPGPYSGVPAGSLQLEDKEWEALSLTIRLEHECAHYFTRRILGSTRNNVLDELIADYCGLDGAIGRYPARWAASFLGLESEHEYRPGGRMEYYRGHLQLSSRTFDLLGRLVRAAINSLERLNTATGRWRGSEAFRIASILAIAPSTLEELAAPQARTELVARFHAWGDSLHLWSSSRPAERDEGSR